MGALPDRWSEYNSVGKAIPGTRFIAFKVPLKEAICRRLPRNEWFTPQNVIEQKPRVSMIIDLTNTTRYYEKTDFENARVSYVKIFCPGHEVPGDHLVAQFFDSVDKFLEEHPDDDTLVGVHCTHGVNRTGFFICKYMIDKMGIEPSAAIEAVGHARGYPIERKNYLAALKNEKYEEEPRPVSQCRWRQPAPHRSEAVRGDFSRSENNYQDSRNESWSRNSYRGSTSSSRDGYPDSRSRAVYLDWRSKDGYSDSRPRDSYADSRSRSAYAYSRPRDAYSNSRPRDAYPDSRPRDAYPDSRPRDAYPDSRPRDAYPDSRPRSDYHAPRTNHHYSRSSHEYRPY